MQTIVSYTVLYMKISLSSFQIVFFALALRFYSVQKQSLLNRLMPFSPLVVDGNGPDGFTYVKRFTVLSINLLV